ncbi:MAG TPA: CheR family methyltransferase [Gemmatimonadaceae bacterium]|nr:CheR family methyltransferase [Gemmatimonadaceae bacterium]
MTGPAVAPDLDELLEYLKRQRGFDFTGYKRASLERRVRRRMQVVGVESYAAYVDYLEVHPEEFAQLFNTILINVTAFFRDPSTWEYVAADVVPRLLSARAADAPLRAWSAGCASGEEAYTLAMVLCEALGSDGFRTRVKIYATDLDDEALHKARHGVYTEREIEGVPEPLRVKYFESADGRYTFRKELRRQVIFGRHDLIQDSPISRVDLLVCRNALMYFNAETQARILARFHFALNDDGILFLGRAETLMTQSSTFMPLDLKRRISAKVPRARLTLRDRLLLAAQNVPEDAEVDGAGLARIREVAFDASPIAQVVVDQAGRLAVATDRARALFQLAPDDIGRPFQDLTLSYRPVELRSNIELVYAESRPLILPEVEWPSPGAEPRWFELRFTPLYDSAVTPIGVSITFTDVTATKRLHTEIEHSNRELETAYEELQSTNEELETTNEELQSTIEELETTNEELQSTNEELETMNEELQSTNEELQTINDEVRTRGDELHKANAFLECILTSISGGVAVTDRQLRVLIWNRRAYELWGLHDEDVIGRNFLNLDIGLPVGQLAPAIRACLAGAEESTTVGLDATDRRGRTIRCSVTCSPLIDRRDEIKGVILIMDEAGSDAAGDGAGDGAGGKWAELRRTEA